MLGGSFGCTEAIPAKKSGIFAFFLLFFSKKIPPFLYPKRHLLNGIYMPNICGTSPTVQRDFFPGRGAPNRHLQQAWKIFPMAAVHPGNILMPRNDPRHQGKLGEGDSHGCCTQEYFDAAEWRQVPGGGQGDVIPMVAAPGSLPNQTEIPVCRPDSCRLPILANYPYWECR